MYAPVCPHDNCGRPIDHPYVDGYWSRYYDLPRTLHPDGSMVFDGNADADRSSFFPQYGGMFLAKTAWLEGWDGCQSELVAETIKLLKEVPACDQARGVL